MITIKNHTFELTKFPDGTQQAWKVTPEPKPFERMEILWQYENDAEFVVILQLGYLLYQQSRRVKLIMPYLPFARQDKDPFNNNCFGLKILDKGLWFAGYSELVAYDTHSNSSSVKSFKPSNFHKSVIDHDIVCYPDRGASLRYDIARPIVYCDKVRNQQTGTIEGLKLNTCDQDLKDKSIVIVDDICDGGATFINVAKELQKYSPKSIDLCVSHGLFSKGKQVLHDAGIRNIYTTNSLLRNPHQYDILSEIWQVT